MELIIMPLFEKPFTKEQFKNVSAFKICNVFCPCGKSIVSGVSVIQDKKTKTTKIIFDTFKVEIKNNEVIIKDFESGKSL